jgi:hypothetical protein
VKALKVLRAGAVEAQNSKGSPPHPMLPSALQHTCACEYALEARVSLSVRLFLVKALKVLRAGAVEAQNSKGSPTHPMLPSALQHT